MHIQVFTDNTTALAYVKNMGETKSKECNQVAKQIWEWAESKRVWLAVDHVTGILNTLADYKSRHFADNLEWELSDEIFSTVCERFGLPKIDLFASRQNAKLDCCFLGPGSRCLETECFHVTMD